MAEIQSVGVVGPEPWAPASPMSLPARNSRTAVRREQRFLDRRLQQIRANLAARPSKASWLRLRLSRLWPAFSPPWTARRWDDGTGR